MALRLRRGSDAERQLVTPLQGELIYATDTKKIYVGDGATLGGVLIGPTAADAFTSVVGDTTPQLGGDLDLNSNNITGVGNINIDGTINATGNIGLGDDDSDVINVSGVINSNLKPALDGQFNLGTNNRRWNNLWAEGAVISGELTTESLTVTSNITTVGSSVLYNAANDTLQAASIVGNLTGNLYADDSTIVVDANQKKFTGEVEGNILSPGLSTFTGGMNITTANIDGGTMDGVAIGQDGVTPVADIKGREVRAQNGFFGNLDGDVTGTLTGDVYGSIKGSVFGGDSSIIIDDTTSTVVGNVNNTTVTTQDFTGATLLLQGTNTLNETAGITILTTGDADGDTNFGIFGANESEIGQSVVYSRSRGTHASPQPLQDGDEVLGQYWFGTDSTNASLPCAAIRVDIVGTPTAGRVPSNMVFATPDSGGNLSIALRINENQETVATKFVGPISRIVGDVQTISGPGAIDLTTLHTEITTTGADAYTLANGTLGQMKIISMAVDGGDATLTPTTLANGTTITFDAVHDNVTLIYGANGWLPIAVQNAVIA